MTPLSESLDRHYRRFTPGKRVDYFFWKTVIPRSVAKATKSLRNLRGARFHADVVHAIAVHCTSRMFQLHKSPSHHILTASAYIPAVLRTFKIGSEAMPV
jgi:hypothetical protein